MSTPLPPGIGNPQQAAQVTAFIREQPWYLEWIQSLGKDPNAQLNLNDQQQEQLHQLAMQHGIGMNSKYDEIGPNGDVVEGHHKLKKAAIAAAIGGLALTGFGAAGIGPMSGVFGGTLGATTTGASMSGLGSGIGTLVPATTSSLAAGLGGGAAAGIGAGAAGGTLATLGATAIPSMTGLGAGAGALVPATTSSLGALGGAAGGAAAAGGATAANSAAGGAGSASAGAGGVLPTTAIPGGAVGTGITPATAGMNGLIPATTPSIGAGGSSALTSTGGILSKLSDPNNLADLSKTIAGYTSGQKADRIVQGEATNLYDRNMLQAQQDRNSNESDAMKKLAQTSYVMGGGSQFKPPTLSLNGKTYNSPDLGYGPPKTTDAEKQGATTLQGQLASRLAPGGSYTPDYSKYGATPGTAEKVGDYVGPALAGAGTVMNWFK